MIKFISILLLVFSNITLADRTIEAKLKLKHVAGTSRVTVLGTVIAESSSKEKDTRTDITGGYELVCPSTPADPKFEYQSSRSFAADPGHVNGLISYPVNNMTDGGPYSAGYPANNIPKLLGNAKFRATERFQFKAHWCRNDVRLSNQCNAEVKSLSGSLRVGLKTL